MVTVKFPKTISLRSVLLFGSLTITLLGMGLMALLAWGSSTRAIDAATTQLRIEINQRIIEHLDSYLGVPRKISTANANLIGSGILPATDGQLLIAHFWQQMQLFDTVSSIYFSNTEGGLANAGKELMDKSLYVIHTENFVAGPFYKHATDKNGQPVRLLVELPNFDGRSRPWYQKARARGWFSWSEPYILFTGQDISISASVPVYDEHNSFMGVAAVDIFLSDLANYLKEFSVSERGQSIIIEKQGTMIAASTGERPFIQAQGTKAAVRLLATESSNPVTAKAAEAILAVCNGTPECRSSQEANNFHFLHEGVHYEGRVSPYSDGYGLDWYVATIIPNTDYMSGIYPYFWAALILVVAIFALISWISLIITNKISMPIVELTENAQTLAQGKPVPRGVYRSRIRELGILSGVFNDMAESLQSTLDGLTREIKERRQTEVELAAAKELAEEANKAKSRFLANMSHEIRTPLNGVIGFAELLLDSNLNEKQKRYAHNAKSSGQLLLGIIGDILDFSKIEAGKLELENVQCDLHELLHEIADISSMQAEQKGLDFSLEIDPALPRCVDTDPIRLKQVLLNLTNNAVKFTAAGSVAIITRFVKQPDQHCIFTVRDTGIGITAEQSENLFRAFSQADNSTTRRFGGTGLGLIISSQLAKMMGSRIEIKSTPNKGSEFSFSLHSQFYDYCESEKPGDKPTDSPKDDSSMNKTDKTQVILIAEDVEMNITLVQAYLERIAPNAKVLAANNGSE
ncbi:MAG: HAMP domain-containing protein, partial [Spirochaetaceae bacterium]